MFNQTVNINDLHDISEIKSVTSLINNNEIGKNVFSIGD